MKEDHLVNAIFGDRDDEQAPAGTPAPATRRRAEAPALPTRASTRAATRERARLQRKQERRRRRRRARRMLILLLAVFLLGAAALGAAQYLRPLVAGLTASDDYTGTGTGRATVEVHSGDSGRAIGATLEKAGVVKTGKAFANLAESNPRGASIQPGTYVLHQHMSAQAALDMLLDPRNRSVPRVTIREGLWKSEVFAALSSATGRPVADYTAAAGDAAALGLPAAAKGNVEGYLFPATYEFDKHSTAAEQMRTMVAKALSELQAQGVAPADDERVLTVASMVEAEGRLDADRPKVAQVIDNRLARKMRLQLDSTVNYGVQHRAITTTDAERADPNPFNTYHVDGLPAGPIGNPGAASIRAAVHPTPGPWLYFVAVNPDTGETRFAVDAAGHAANERLFHQWCSAHPGKC